MIMINRTAHVNPSVFGQGLKDGREVPQKSGRFWSYEGESSPQCRSDIVFLVIIRFILQ